MRFVRGDRRRPFNRYTAVRLGVLLLAAGIWVGGVLTDRPAVTGAAIALLLIGLGIGILERMRR